MEIEAKKVVWSEFVETDLENIFLWGKDTFGFLVADRYTDDMLEKIQQLEYRYLIHPPCLQLPTKNKIYRNIITDSHRIVYRVLSNRVEVLRIFHLASSNTKIKSARTIRVIE